MSATAAIAGLYDRWDRGDQVIETCTVIVTDATASISDKHDRMPVILDPADYRFWLDPGIDDVPALKELLKPAPADWLTARPVANPRQPRDDDPTLIDAVAIEV